MKKTRKEKGIQLKRKGKKVKKIQIKKEKENWVRKRGFNVRKLKIKKEKEKRENKS